MEDKFEGLVEHLLKGGFFMQEAVELLEKSMIERALLSSGGNRSVASKALGIHRNTLQRKIAEYKLSPSGRKPPRSSGPASWLARRAKSG